jgi:hypothetical protein
MQNEFKDYLISEEANPELVDYGINLKPVVEHVQWAAQSREIISLFLNTSFGRRQVLIRNDEVHGKSAKYIGDLIIERIKR